MMNRIRRKHLAELMGKMEEIIADLEALKEEEEDYRDNMPENLQGSERYEKADEACDSLDSAVSSIEDALSYIAEATE